VTFEQFATARLPGLLRYAVALTGDWHLAQDVVQEVLARALVRWRRISGADSPDAYVRRMVRNEYLSWRRSRAVRNLHLTGEFPEDIDDTRGWVHDHADRIAESDAMGNRLAVLGRKQRAVLVLRYYEQLDDKTIAVLLDCSPVTVRGQARKALRTLRLRWEREPAAAGERSRRASPVASDTLPASTTN
jgi:RNA polymerase sigma-70 factor (sigma-E family)